MATKTQYNPERIEALKQILLRLHEGESPETVQEEFDKHFTNVSAVEISLMEHELMNGDHGISFEDVMKLCNVHANVFGGNVAGEETLESKHPGHPVQVFKNENMAFQSTMIRVNRIFDSLEKDHTLIQEAGVIEGLKNQLSLLGEFHIHYSRKEKLFFPIMEHYGHDAPPKVMWGVDDEIRDLYKLAKKMVSKLPVVTIDKVRESYNIFEHEFKEMIFKEESILLPMILSFFTEDDWLTIAEESDAIGYAIVEPEEKWEPKRQLFKEDVINNQTESALDDIKINEEGANSVTKTPDNEIAHLVNEVKRLSHKVAELSEAYSEKQHTTGNLSFGGGYLTTHEANHILNNLPLELTFVDKNDVFKYFNDKEKADMILLRTSSMVGRNVENCHPPKSLPKVMTLISDLKARKRTSESMWFKKADQYVHITYKGVFDENGEYLGILEYVQDIQPFLDLPDF